MKIEMKMRLTRMQLRSLVNTELLNVMGTVFMYEKDCSVELNVDSNDLDWVKPLVNQITANNLSAKVDVTKSVVQFPNAQEFFEKENDETNTEN